MNDLVNLPKLMKDLEAEVREMSDDQLRAELFKGLQLTVLAVVRVVVLLREYDSRKIPVTRDDLPDLHHFRRIASGQVRPELYVMFFKRSSLVGRLGNLPLADQEKIINGERFQVAVTTPDGKGYTHRMMGVNEMLEDKKLIDQVFATDHVRPVSEQLLVLDQRRAEAAKPSPLVKIRAQHRPKGLVINGLFVSIDDLLPAIRRLVPQEELAGA